MYLTASAVAIWFYDKTDEYDLIITPFKNMAQFHLGTITFASVWITFAKVLQLILKLAALRRFKGYIGGIGKIVACIIQCFLGAL